MKSKNILLFIIIASLFSCNKKPEKNTYTLTEKKEETQALEKKEYKLSLAQWSVHKLIFDGDMDPLDFSAFAKKLEFDGVEYVTQLYKTGGSTYEEKKQNVGNLALELKRRSDSLGIKNVLIMIDQEGELASENTIEIDSAILKHTLWVDAAKVMGCHSIRVNLFGSESDSTLWISNSVKSLKILSEYAQKKSINVIVENHGGFSSNAKLLVKVIKGVGMENCGTLPDFGNFCMAREGGARWEAPCISEYDKYLGVTELMPYAKAISVKSIEFDELGNETTIDFKKMFEIVKRSDYEGYLGIEWESDYITSEEGIELTKKLITKSL